LILILALRLRKEFPYSTSASHRSPLFKEMCPPDKSITPPVFALTEAEAEAAISRFQNFLRFPTVSSISVESGAYRDCASWLVQELQSLAILDDVFLLPEAPEHSPVVVGLWKGRDEALPILLLNSHYDVVPADDWSVPPFDGLRVDGKIYGRGTQDMKCVCMQYVEAILKLQQLHPEWMPERNIYLTFVPDEGGCVSLCLFSSTDNLCCMLEWARIYRFLTFLSAVFIIKRLEGVEWRPF
jgi:Peptidase family M20/M25/M40